MSTPRALPSAVWLGLSLAIAGCVGTIGDADEGGGPGRGGGVQPANPQGFLTVPAARLTSLQYQLTLRALFPGLALPALSLPDEVVIDGFANNARAQAPSPQLVENLQANASAVAALAVADVTKLLPCKVSAPADEVPCGGAFLDAFGARAFRRPLADDERARLRASFAAAHDAYGFSVAVRMSIETILQSPQFLYLVDLGAIQPDGRFLLQPYEIASRVSYFLWNTMPDDALLAAAESGRLTDPAEVEAQGRRMLADPRAHDAVAAFHRQWLNLGLITSLTRDAASFPWWNDGSSSSDLQASTAMYADYLFWQQGTLQAFFTDAHGFVNDNVGKSFGVAAPGGATLKLAALDAQQRAGILTQPGLMAAFAHNLNDSPVKRGVFVLSRLLCAPPPPPPPGGAPPPPTAGATPKTTRELFAQTHEQGTCAGCHHTIDGVGFGFEHYDATGAWRTTEAGQPIDATGWLGGTDIDGPFDGAVDLGKKLATSKQAQACVAKQWLRFSLGLGMSEVNDAMLTPVAKDFAAHGTDVRELLITVLKSDAFRYRVRTQ